MEFHQRTLNLFGHPHLPLDPERKASSIHSAADLGVALPAAVAEWYSVPVRSELWRWYSSDDQPAIWRKDGDNCMHHLESEEQDNYREWWVHPAVCHDPTSWVKGRILPLMCENQGSWLWGISLDGTADPTALISLDGGYMWDICAESFSAKVYAIIFDRALWKPAGIQRRFQLPEWVSGHQRQALRNEFEVGPITREAAGLFMERFSGLRQRVHFYNHWGTFSSDWHLWAEDQGAYSDLTDRLRRIFPALDHLLPEYREQTDVEIPF